MENFLFLTILLLAGQFFYRQKFPEDFGKSLNLFLIYLSLPAMVLYQLPKLHFEFSLISYIVIPWTILVVSVALLWVIFKVLPVEKGVKASLYLLIPLGNTSFVGIPMIEVFYGQSFIPQALIYDQFGTFLILATYGSIAISIFSGEKIKVSKITKKIFIFPPFIALLVALFIPIPEILAPALKTLSLTLVPLAIVSVGFSLRLRVDEHKFIFALGLFIKLFILPLIALAVIYLFGFDLNVAKVAVFEAGMGPMVTAGILAMTAGFAPKFTASFVGYGIIFSFGSLPLLFLLLEAMTAS